MLTPPTCHGNLQPGYEAAAATTAEKQNKNPPSPLIFSGYDAVVDAVAANLDWDRASELERHCIPTQLFESID